MKKFLIIAFICISGYSCLDKARSETATMVPDKETLPFFNQPDWTPEWITQNDSTYKKIHSIPAFSFMDQDGNNITEQTIKGKIYVANFFFSKCNNICPKMTANMHKLQDAFGNDGGVILLSHSVTPEDDNISVLKKFATENEVLSSKWHLLTGDKSEIYRLAKKEYFAGDSVGYYQSGNEFLHTENFILIDKHRRIRGVYNGTLAVEVERIVKDIAILKEEK
ncbi:MAG TPA: SCO family protein [Chitinophagaceae bacterium]|nr:SCO family protein [Chitinophagaceae bacterium]